MRREIIITQAVHDRIVDLCAEASPNEAMAVLAGNWSTSPRHCRLLVKTVFLPRSSDYAEQTPVTVRPSKSWLHDVLRCCASRQLHPVLLHTHPFSHGSVCESGLDLAAGDQVLPAVVRAFPGMGVATMVVDKGFNHAEAHFYNVSTDRRDSVDQIIIPCRSRLKIVIPQSSAIALTGSRLDKLFWSRFALAFGPELPRLTKHVHVGVIGTGSLGESIAVQLANLGFALTLLDSDVFAVENVNRSWYGNRGDADRCIPKVRLCQEAIRHSNPDASAVAIFGDVREAGIQDQLKPCHMLVVATDSVVTRGICSHLAMAHGQVMFDAGTAIDVENGVLKSIRGQIMRLAPGLNLCHACAGFLDPNRMRQGLLNEGDYKTERERGYVVGADMPAPSVMPVNTFLAGACVWEILRYLSGATPDHSPDMVSFDLLGNGATPHFYERNEDGQRVRCATCSPDGYLFAGDRAPFLTREAAPSTRRFAGAMEQIGEGDHGSTNPAE